MSSTCQVLCYRTPSKSNLLSRLSFSTCKYTTYSINNILISNNNNGNNDSGINMISSQLNSLAPASPPYYSSPHHQSITNAQPKIDFHFGLKRWMSTTPSYKNTDESVYGGDGSGSFSHAIVDHKEAYEKSMEGRHGKQLALSYDEGLGKDEEDEDAFAYYFGEAEKEDEMDDYDEDMDVNSLEAKGKEEDDEDMDDEEEEFLEQEEDLEEEEDIMKFYNNDGSLSTRKESELIALRSGAPAGGTFAIIKLEGFQHKVAIDDLIITNKLKPVSLWKVGRILTIKSDGSIENKEDEEVDGKVRGAGDVLLVASQDKTYVGLPAVKGAEVDILVEEITHDKTMIVFKKRRRKHSRRKNGFRREVTFLRVLDIRMPTDSSDE